MKSRWIHAAESYDNTESVTLWRMLVEGVPVMKSVAVRRTPEGMVVGDFDVRYYVGDMEFATLEEAEGWIRENKEQLKNKRE